MGNHTLADIQLLESPIPLSVLCPLSRKSGPSPLQTRGEREFPFPTIPRNTRLPFPFPKLKSAILQSCKHLFPGNSLSRLGIRSEILAHFWEKPFPKWAELFPFLKSKKSFSLMCYVCFLWLLEKRCG